MPGTSSASYLAAGAEPRDHAMGIARIRRSLTSAAIAVGCVLSASCRGASTPTPQPVGHQPGEEAAVLAVMDDYLRALSTNDLAAMAKLQTTDGMTYVAAPSRDGRVEIAGRPNAFWVDPANSGGGAVRERYWSPTVFIRGSIAVVWAPYEFWAGGKSTHCGVDVFDFVKMEQRWLIANSMWTVEPQACTGLRPVDPSALRPPG